MAINPVATQTDPTKIASLADLTRATDAQVSTKNSAPAATPTAVKDTVQISTAAQEASETAAQTAQEANRGDQQAQKLMAKSAAARAELQGSNTSSILGPQ